MAGTTTQTVREDAAPATADQAPAAVAAPIRIMAMGLWGVVGSLLTYGVVMTAIKAAALFG